MKKSSGSYPSRHLDQFVVRLPDGMRKQLANAAHRNNRSMNAEIVSVLQAGLERHNVTTTEVFHDNPVAADTLKALDLIIDAAVTAHSRLQKGDKH